MLTTLQRQEYKRRAHALKPVVLLGQHGLTPAVIREIDIALTAHELIKVKIPEPDKNVSNTIVDEICKHCEADLVGVIGRIAILHRPNTQRK